MMKKKKSLGFSLVELLLAIVILALIATPILRTIITGYTLNLKSNDMLCAADLASSICEFASNKVYEDFTYKDSSNNDVTIRGLGYYFGVSKDGSGNDVNDAYINSLPNGSKRIYPNGPSCANSMNNTDYPADTYDNKYQKDPSLHGKQTGFWAVKYDNREYNVRVIVIPGVDSLNSSPEYFTYDVIVEVYSGHYNEAGKKHQADTLAVNPDANVNEVFNYGTIHSGYYDLLATQTVSIANKY